MKRNIGEISVETVPACFHSFPTELWRVIFKFLDFSTASSLQHVSKWFSQIFWSNLQTFTLSARTPREIVKKLNVTSVTDIRLEYRGFTNGEFLSDDFSACSTLSCVVRLVLLSVKLDRKSLPLLQKFQNLEELQILKSDFEIKETERSFSFSTQHLALLTTLKYLRFCENSFVDNHQLFRDISSLTKLKDLIFMPHAKSELPTDRCFCFMTTLTNLVILGISGIMKENLDNVLCLCSLTNLECLAVSYNETSDDYFKIMGKLTNLHALSVVPWATTKQSFTTEGISFLTSLTKLRQMFLPFDDLNPEVLEPFKKLKKLAFLGLNKGVCIRSEKELAIFKNSHPNKNLLVASFYD